MRPKAESVLLVVCVLLFTAGLFRHLSRPLLWQDEAETAMFATRILEYGFPKVHGDRNVVNEFGDNPEMGVKPGLDAYIGVTWAQFYYAAPGVFAARGVEDRYAKTLLLRLPFALTGLLGLATLVLAVTPVFRGDRRRSQLFGALFFLLASVSLSLVLHLREVRYYALLVLLVSGSFWVYLRYSVFGTLGHRTYAVSLTLLLLLLFNTFYPAYFIFAAVVGIDRGLAALRSEGAATRRLQRELPAVAPLLASALVVAPLLHFYQTFDVASAFSEAFGLTPRRYVDNLGLLLGHQLRHEFLAAAVASRLAVAAAASQLRGRGEAVGAELPRRVSALFSLFFVVYALAGCVNPLFYERYFVVLSPFVTAVFLLDAFSLMELAPALLPAPRRAAASTLTLCALLAMGAASVAVRSSDLRGRIEELTHPYAGPVDVAIAYLIESHPQPEELVIATNYAAHTYMYYLGSHVIVGMSRNNIEQDRLLQADVVIPRRRWPKGLAELQPFVVPGAFRRVMFPVEDREFNNIPALTVTPWIRDTHRFRTPATSQEDEKLRLFERIVAP